VRGNLHLLELFYADENVDYVDYAEISEKLKNWD
jgi:hypothetical protein